MTNSKQTGGKVDVFEIIYDNEQAVYREGDSVSGTVKLELNEDIKTKGKQINSLTMNLYSSVGLVFVTPLIISDCRNGA